MLLLMSACKYQRERLAYKSMFSSLAPLLSVRAPLCVPERRWWGGTPMRDEEYRWGNMLKGSLTPPSKSVPGTYASVANTPLHLDITGIHHCYCCLLPQAPAQLLIARIKAGLQSSLPPQPLLMAHLYSIAPDLCGMGGGMMAATLVAKHIVYFTVHLRSPR